MHTYAYQTEGQGTFISDTTANAAATIAVAVAAVVLYAICSRRLEREQVRMEKRSSERPKRFF